MQEAFRHKEERIVTGDGRLKEVLDAVVIFWAVELEKAMLLPKDDIVKMGEIWAESLGQTLAGELAEIGEGVQPPEFQDRDLREREVLKLRLGEVLERKLEGLISTRKGGEMSEIWGGAEANLEGECEEG